MNRNQIKNLKELKNMSFLVPKSRKSSFNSIVVLYEKGYFPNIKSALSLTQLLGSRGVGPVKAVEVISQMQSKMDKDSMKDALTTLETESSSRQTQEERENRHASKTLLNIDGYNPSEATPKRTREEQILNTTTTRRLKKAVGDVHDKRKTHWTKSALEGSFREIIIEDDFKNGNNRIMFNDQDLKENLSKIISRCKLFHTGPHLPTDFDVFTVFDKYHIRRPRHPH